MELMSNSGRQQILLEHRRNRRTTRYIDCQISHCQKLFRI
jgi:hypothetical protein